MADVSAQDAIGACWRVLCSGAEGCAWALEQLLRYDVVAVSALLATPSRRRAGPAGAAGERRQNLEWAFC